MVKVFCFARGIVTQVPRDERSSALLQCARSTARCDRVEVLTLILQARQAAYVVGALRRSSKAASSSRLATPVLPIAR
jgi:hypothetical protein